MSHPMPKAVADALDAHAEVMAATAVDPREAEIRAVVDAAVEVVGDRLEYARMVQMPTALSREAQATLRALFAAVDEYLRLASATAERSEDAPERCPMSGIVLEE